MKPYNLVQLEILSPHETLNLMHHHEMLNLIHHRKALFSLVNPTLSPEILFTLVKPYLTFSPHPKTYTPS